MKFRSQLRFGHSAGTLLHLLIGMRLQMLPFLSEKRGRVFHYTMQLYQMEVNLVRLDFGWMKVTMLISKVLYGVILMQVPFQVPLEVNVVLIGFSGDGGYRYTMDSQKLEEFLRVGFPSHRPSCQETGEPLDIEHHMVFNAFPVSSFDTHLVYLAKLFKYVIFETALFEYLLSFTAGSTARTDST